MSKTAEFVAAIRAHHLRRHPEPIFADTYAEVMLPWQWRMVVRTPVLSALVFERLYRNVRYLHSKVVLRASYNEQHLQKAINKGVTQYVILGAGLDTFALRRPELRDKLRVFEVDKPKFQWHKRQRIMRLREGFPANLELLGVDFNCENLASALARSSFDPASPAFFSWLGVSIYLTNDTVHSTLQQVASIGAPGSYIVFDYRLPRQIARSNAERQQVRGLEEFGATRGEPLLSQFTKAEMAAMLERLHFIVEHRLPPSAQERCIANKGMPAIAPTTEIVKVRF